VVSAGPAFNLSQIIYQLRTQWGGNPGSYAGEGTYRAWFGTNVSYSIADFYPTNGSYSETNAFVMSAVMKDTARLGFELWDDAIAINLNESVNNPAANITVNYASGTSGGGTYAKPFLGGQSGGYYQITAQQIWLNSTWQSHDQDSDMYYGGYGVTTFVHEIGHTLGLSHPGTYNAGSGGTITYANNAEFAQDNRQFTIMSYFGGYNPTTNSWTQDGTNLSYYFPSTPMVYDIAAIQATYGADFSTRSGNSTYGFNITSDVAARSANGLAVYSFAQNAHPIFTIWDGGGIDTLDCSGYSANQTISLVAGSYSSVGGMNDNIGIAYNCTIENATGGSGNDTFTGNSANNMLLGNGGNDTFYGDAGNDTINGGANVDTVNYASAQQSVVVDLPGRIALGVEIGTDTIDGIENVTTGSGNDAVAGNGAINVLNGGAGIDTVSYYMVSSGVVLDLAFNVGVDNTSRDTLLNFENANGTAYNDAISGTAAVNVLDGLGGVDTISYYGSAQRVVVDLAAGTGISGGVTDTLRNFENVNGSAYGDAITGNGGVNVLNGLGGVDTLTGGASGDTFVFAAGQANGDSITDFSGNGAAAGDALLFQGFGTAAQGATLTQFDATHWQIHSGLDGHNELITLANGAGVHASDFYFV
jgi:Ca2+-binding RTX toxin-like protein